MSYQQEYDRSISNPEVFWQEKSKDIHWFKSPETIISTDSNSVSHWFVDGELNSCYLALDEHVINGRGDQTALIYDSPVTDTQQKFTYLELKDQTALFAGVLSSLGVKKGDRVVIYMPMVPETVVAMLACARIGAVHSVVFGGFASPELKVRIDDAEPDVIISASCGIEVNKVIPYKPLLDKAIEMAECKPKHCIILQRSQSKAEMIKGRDKDWSELIASAEPVDCVPVKATDPLYILYTSGTTGKPKGIVRDNGGHAVALKYSMKALYDMDPGDVYWAASDVGWVVGHSYIVYGPLFAGCTTVLYEGKPVGTPDAGAFWRVIQDYSVNAIFTAPTAFRAIKKEDPNAEELKKYDISSLKTLFLAGERLDPPTYEWLDSITGLPIVDHWWQTETGWAIVANLKGLDAIPTKPGSATYPVPGFNVSIFDDEGHEQPPLNHGEIVIKLPLPPGCFPTIWKDPERFQSAYLETYPGYYLSGDEGYKDEEGYVFIMGRSDDVINVAGHRFSTGEMEEQIASHNAVAECAVIAVKDELKGHIPVAMVIIKNSEDISEMEIEKALAQHMREEVGAVASLKNVLIVERLPKTRSGKILRKILRKIADGEEYLIPSTIDDPLSLTEIEQHMKERGIGVFS